MIKRASGPDRCYAALAAQLVQFFEQNNVASDGRFAFDQEYLLAVLDKTSVR